jgi:hypothetical protein
MLHASSLLLADSSSGGAAAFLAAIVLSIALTLVIQSLLGGLMFYKVLEKGHQPAWVSFVPFYNYMLLFKMSGKNPNLGLIMLGVFIPFIGGLIFLAGWIMLGMAVGKAFGKDTGWIVGLILLGVVFYPIIGFGSSQYVLAPAPAAQAPGAPV